MKDVLAWFGPGQQEGNGEIKMYVQRQSYRVDLVAARGKRPARRKWRWHWDKCIPLVMMMVGFILAVIGIIEGAWLLTK